MTYNFVRSVRTLSSEVYQIWEGERRVGQVDLHYADTTVQATVVLERELSPEQQRALLTQLDDDIVCSYLAVGEREDFAVVVFRGEEIASLSHPPAQEQDW